MVWHSDNIVYKKKQLYSSNLKNLIILVVYIDTFMRTY